MNLGGKMEIRGFKAFHYPMKNRYGKVFEENHIYTIPGELRFGNNGNGFHFCKRLEDTLRYFPGMEEEISIAKVSALGRFLERNDEYNGYYDMYCTNKIRIDKILNRSEIVNPYLSLDEERVIRFLQGFCLTKEELEFFKLRYEDHPRIMDAISYYQEKNYDTYQKKYFIERK